MKTERSNFNLENLTLDMEKLLNLLGNYIVKFPLFMNLSDGMNEILFKITSGK
jgi:hypothetical protein